MKTNGMPDMPDVTFVKTLKQFSVRWNAEVSRYTVLKAAKCSKKNQFPFF